MLVIGREVARGAASGAEVRSLNYELLTIKNGLILRFREFYDERDADRRAVGIGVAEIPACRRAWR